MKNNKQNVILNKSFFTLGENGIANDIYNREFLDFVANIPEVKKPVQVGFRKINPLSDTSIKRNFLKRYSYGTLLIGIQGWGNTVFGTVEAVALIQFLIEKQKNGESGDLLVEKDNFLFMKKNDGHINRVSLHWCGKGWVINMFSVEMDGNCGGRQGDNCFIQE